MMRQTKIKQILAYFLIILQFIFLLNFLNVDAATSDYKTILKKVGITTTYAKKYKETGNAMVLNLSYITSKRYNNEDIWFYLEDERLNQELTVDANGLAELKNLPNLKVPTGDSVDFNLMIAVLLKNNTYGGFPFLISQQIAQNINQKNESSQYESAKAYFEKNKNMFLAVIDGENLINLYNTNNSINLETLIENYYNETSASDRYVKFVSNLWGENFEFTKENLRQKFYTKLINDEFFLEGLEELDIVDRDGSYASYEPLIKNTIYAFSDMVYDLYPQLNIEKMEFTYERNALEVNHDYNIQISTSPKNVKNPQIKFTSSNPEIASVNENGTLHTNKLGKFTLTATSGDIYIQKEFQVFEEGTIVELDQKTLSLAIKQGKQLNATIKPETSSQKILWESKNSQIATVSDNGYVEAISQGQTIIVASTETGATAECVVTVGQPVYNVKIEDAPQYLEKGATYELQVKVNPENATNTDIKFMSNNEKVLKVDEEGILTAIDKGKAKITVQSVSDASVYDEKTIIVSSKIKEIKTPKEMNVFLDYNTPIEVQLEPKDASLDRLEYKVSNDVISVDAKGNIYGNMLGDSEITITAKDNPSIKETMEIHVVQPVTEINLNSNDIKLKKGETFSLTIDVAPRDAWNNEYEITVENPEICSLNGINHITGLKAGETKIIVTAKDGSGIETICNVKVTDSKVLIIIISILFVILLITGLILFINRKKLKAYIRGF